MRAMLSRNKGIMHEILALLAVAVLVITFMAPAVAAEASADSDDRDLSVGWQANLSLLDEFAYGSRMTRRINFGNWNFGSGKLSVSQFYGPADIFYGLDVFNGDFNLFPTDDVHNNPSPTILPRVGNLDVGPLGLSNWRTVRGVEESTPIIFRMEARYLFNLGPYQFEIAGGGGYNSYEEAITASDIEFEIGSYIGYVGAKVPVGPFYFSGNAFYGQNVGDSRVWGAADFRPTVSEYNKVDKDSIGYQIVGGFRLKDIAIFEAGWGYTELYPDIPMQTEEDVNAWYFQAQIHLGNRILIVPEIGAINFNADRRQDEGETVYYGAKWQIKF